MSESVSATSDAPPLPRKRPIWVWIITVYFLFSIVFTLLSFLLLLSGQIPINQVQEDYLNSLTFSDYALTALLSATNLAAVITLFLLKRQAYHLFIATFVINVLFTTYHALTTDWFAATGIPAFIGILFSFGCEIVLILYARWLIARGTLA